MKAIVITMLVVQAAMILAVAWTILTARGGAGARRPIFPAIVIPPVVAAGASWNIGDHHAGQPGADVLMFGAALLFGMAIMGALFALRKKRGLD